MVARDPQTPGVYLLLDGHLRVEVLKDMGKTEVECLVSTDDEAFTYNKRVSRLAAVQERNMILKAIERGVSQDKIARALDINVQSVQRKVRMLDGICDEANQGAHLGSMSSVRSERRPKRVGNGSADRRPCRRVIPSCRGRPCHSPPRTCLCSDQLAGKSVSRHRPNPRRRVPSTAACTKQDSVGCHTKVGSVRRDDVGACRAWPGDPV